MSHLKTAQQIPKKGWKLSAFKLVLLFLIVLSVVAFILNWIWEMAQMFAYVEMQNQPFGKTILPCTLASVGDAALTLLAYGLGALFTRNLRWGIQDGWRVYLTLAIFGTIFAIIIEQIAKAAGHWSYNERMPIVPLMEVGLLPLLQLTLLLPAALWLTVRLQKNKIKEVNKNT